MSAAAVVALVVAVGEAQAPATASMLAAAREALGPGVSIELRAVASPSDDEALRAESEMAAQAVIALLWRDASRTRARVRLHVARTTRWTERELAFSAGDTLVERGRALGFAVASMLPEADSAIQVAAAPPEPSPPSPSPAPAPAPAAPAPPLGTHAVGVTAIGSAGIGGPAGGLGGAVDGQLFVTPALSLRVALGARGGAVSELPGTDLAASLGAGAVWWPLAPAAGRRLAVGLRADALVLYHAVTYQAAGTAPQREGRFLPGADLMVTAGWRLAQRAEAVVGAGVEAAFGSTALIVQGAPVASVPALRGVGEAGVRLRF